MHVLLASKCPTRKSIMIRPTGKKQPQNRACSCTRPAMQHQPAQLGRVGSGATRRAGAAGGAPLSSCMPTAPPCTCTCAAPPRGRAGPSQGPLFRSAAHGGRERARAKVHLFKRSSRRFLPFFDSADLCQLKGSLGAGKTGWPVVQLEVKWSQFSSSARKGSKVYWAANRLTIKNEDSCLAERCRGEAAADGLGIWQAVWCKGPRV